MTVYLDTHAVALALGPSKHFPRRALSLMRRAGALKVSPAAVLELQLLREIGRMKASPQQVIAGLAEAFSLTVCERPFAAVADAALGMSWTRDPFDRLIVAQAAIADSLLITKDERIRKHYEGTLGLTG